MQFPHVVLNEADKFTDNYRLRFQAGRAVKETVWRRHQCEENQMASGWFSPDDARRRLFHVRDEYDMNDGRFVLKNSYMYLNVKNTKEEINKYLDTIEVNRKEGGWAVKEYRPDHQVLCLGDLLCELRVRDHNPYDVHFHYPLPANYRDLEVRLRSVNLVPDDKLTHTPWHVLRTAGIRKSFSKGIPEEISRNDLADFFPAHVELGCGPSIEAGIPPLHYLHKVYGVMTENKSFIFNAEDDAFLSVFSDPSQKFHDTTYIHLKTLQAEPTPFYRQMKKLAWESKILEPILTNNFDGLALSVGLEEKFMRAFDQGGTFPALEFRPEAKSLFVIGCHADRRTCQAQARSQGLNIVYIDPEGYEREDGQFLPYALESPQAGDYLLRLPAKDIFSTE